MEFCSQWFSHSADKFMMVVEYLQDTGSWLLLEGIHQEETEQSDNFIVTLSYKIAISTLFD